MSDLGNFPFIEAKYKTVLPARSIDGICLHDMEALELQDTAENVARYFQRITTPASAHLNFDDNSCVRSVHDKDIAYGAPGVNHNFVHFEHAGFARQSREDWLDDYGKAMLFDMPNASAKVCGDYCIAKGFPARIVTPEDLRAGGDRQRGITTHLNVTLSKIAPGDHTDPGQNFPLAQYVTAVQQHISNNHPVEVIVARIPNLVGSTTLPNGGILLVGSDGGIFNIHGAPFKGNLVGKQLNAPPVDVVAFDNDGYWIVCADMGIDAFGSAPQVDRSAYPYDKFYNEYKAGTHAARFGSYDPNSKKLTIVADDLNGYDFPIAA
jgi:hypothetical protein